MNENLDFFPIPIMGNDQNLKIELDMKWINVNDRLPDLNVEVLVCDGENLTCAHRNKYSPTGIILWHEDCETFGTPTHWMPLPDMPKDVDTILSQKCVE